MPIYDYFCSSCFETSSRFLPMAQRHEPSPCPHCTNGQLQLQITAPRSLQFKDSPIRALTPQQQLAGTQAQGPGMQSGIRSSVLHNCKGPSCSVCATA